ncbi:MAG: DUF4097 family beta strand repeat-containing protein [Streptosporangiaceae bacterium]
MPTFDSPEPVLATIELFSGRLRISAGDRADTTVEVRPTSPSRAADVKAAEQTEISYADGRLVVKSPRVTTRSLVGRDGSVDVTVDLPAGSRFDARATVGISADGRIGDSNLRTAAGNVRLDHTAKLTVEVGTGDITVVRADGPVRLGTASGRITVDRARDDVDARTVAGGIRIGEVIRGSVVLHTTAGRIEVGIAEGTAARLDVNSLSGRVHTDVGDPGTPGETVRVRARAVTGDIRVRRA